MMSGTFDSFKARNKKVFEDMGVESDRLAFHAKSGAGDTSRLFSAVQDAMKQNSSMSASIDPSQQSPPDLARDSVYIAKLSAEALMRKNWVAIAIPVLVAALIYALFAILL